MKGREILIASGTDEQIPHTVLSICEIQLEGPSNNAITVYFHHPVFKKICVNVYRKYKMETKISRGKYFLISAIKFSAIQNADRVVQFYESLTGEIVWRRKHVSSFVEEITSILLLKLGVEIPKLRLAPSHLAATLCTLQLSHLLCRPLQQSHRWSNTTIENK